MSRQRVCVDSGFWIALYEPESEGDRAEAASLIAEMLEDCDICIPWPTMYEFVNSKLGRNRDRLNQFKRVVERPTTIRINDSSYKDAALTNMFNNHSHGFNDISLVDEVIKLMLQDVALSINYFVSFDTALVNFAAAHGIGTGLHL